jgi:murein DD-endopeptidase MepM/ murein hydrolase activator NlpD
VAPCGGVVLAVVGGLRDMPVPQYDRANMAGNHVLLDCQGVHVVLAHFRNASVRVLVGDTVNEGDVLGAVGNSGGTNEPHLHIHAQRPGPAGVPFGGAPVPIRLGGRYLIRGDRVVVDSM